MTVREAVGVLLNAKKIEISLDGNYIELKPEDDGIMEIFGEYEVRHIFCGGDNVEISIKTIPVRVKRE